MLCGGVLAAAEDEAPGEAVNRVRYVIGEIPLTQIDIDNMKRHLRGMKKFTSDKAAIEELIGRTIVEIEAKKESIIISDQRMDNEVKRRMEAAGINSEAAFRKLLEKETGFSYEDWYSETRYELLKRQLIMISVSVAQPTEKDLHDFYNRNKFRIGDELLYREIVFRPANMSVDEEIRVSDIAKKVRAQVAMQPANFSSVAKSHPENVSSYRGSGGLVSYSSIQDIIRKDQILANVLYAMKVGEVSQIFRDQGNRYVIVKLEGRRPVSFERVQNLIRQMMYMEKEDTSFAQWIEKKKGEIAIREID
jgi:putative peptidyl-prolyl cis-trans isomerase